MAGELAPRTPPSVMTRDDLRATGMTADEVITSFKQAAVRREFPDQFLHSTVAEIEAAARHGDRAARRALKLLIERRFDKR